MALAGNPSISAIEIPSTNVNSPHVSCVNDGVMNKVLQFTIYTDDDDSVTNDDDRQRIEMKVFEKSPTSYKAVKNTN